MFGCDGGEFSMKPIDDATQDILQSFGFDSDRFESQRDRLKTGLARSEHNRISGEVTAPAEGDVIDLPPPGSVERSALDTLGREAISRGEVGVVVLAGGMATRFGGVVKAGVEAIPGSTFLEVKLKDAARAAELAGGSVPVFPMSSFATHADVLRMGEAVSTVQTPVHVFSQFISLRMNEDGSLFRTEDGALSPYACGHGDLSFALRRSGVLSQFREAGGRLLMMSNVDNLTATVDAAVIGAHLQAGRPMTAEVAPKLPGDKGGAPARVNGDAQIVEGFRFPDEFDQDTIPVFNTNTLVFDADAIDREFELDFFAVRKSVGGKPAVQFERLVGQLSAFMPTTFLRVQRAGEDARFQPAKDPAELKRRQSEILLALRARGIVS